MNKVIIDEALLLLVSLFWLGLENSANLPMQPLFYNILY